MVFLVASAPARAAAPGSAEEADLRQQIAAVLAQHGIPGAGIALVGRGAPRAFGVGLADPAGGRPVAADTLFRAGSVSKSVTALAVMCLVEKGSLSLHDQLRRLAPEVSFVNPWEVERPVRVENLLEHTTGWEFLHYVEEWEDAPAPRPLLEVIRRSPASRRCRWPPGAYAAYSNEGYLVAGLLIEKLAGAPFDQAARRLVLDPLGMQDSAFRLDPAGAARLAVGTRQGRPVAYREDGIRPAAGMLTSARDMARWLAFWVGRGSDGRGPVSPGAVARIEQTRSLEGPGPDLVYGLGNEGAEVAGLAVRGHTGFTDGFTAAFHYAPEAGVGWAVLLDGESGEALVRIEEAIVASLGLHLPTAAAPAAPEPAALQEVEGWYQDITPARTIWAPLGAIGGRQVSVRGGSLQQRSLEVTRPVDLFRTEAWQRLEPRRGGRFALPGSTTPGIRFVRRGADILMVEELGAWRRVDARWAGLRRLALAAALALLCTSLVSAPAIFLRKARSRGAEPHALLPAAIAALALIGARLLISHGSGQLATPGVVSVAIFVLSLAFAALALATPAAACLDLRRTAVPAAVKVYQLLLGTACLGLGLWGWRAGWIALQTWRS